MNKGGLDVTSIRLVDNRFGLIADGFALRNGESRSFVLSIVPNDSLTIDAEMSALVVDEDGTFSFKKTRKINVRD